jgi:hemerythrin
MTIITWSNQFSVGIDSIDRQHQKLIQLINQLNREMANGDANIAVSEILNQLTDYTEYHFQFEEAMLEEFNYPSEQQHKDSHRALITQLEGLKLNFESDISGAIALEIMQFLQSWLTEHILKSDMAYSKFLISKGAQ